MTKMCLPKRDKSIRTPTRDVAPMRPRSSLGLLIETVQVRVGLRLPV